MLKLLFSLGMIRWMIVKTVQFDRVTLPDLLCYGSSLTPFSTSLNTFPICTIFICIFFSRIHEPFPYQFQLTFLCCCKNGFIMIIYLKIEEILFMVSRQCETIAERKYNSSIFLDSFFEGK